MRPLPLFCCLIAASSALQLPLHTLSQPATCARRACAILCADDAGDDDEPPQIDGEKLVEEIRNALGDQISMGEKIESNKRWISDYVDMRKDEAAEAVADLDRELENVRDSIETKLDGELSALKAETAAKIDAAVAELRASNAQGPPSARSAAGGAAGGGGAGGAGGTAAGAAGAAQLSPELPADALVVVAGATTEVGGLVLRALGGAQPGWRLRALLPDGDGGGGLPEGVETKAFAPFAPTALKQSLAGADALLIVGAAAGGKGGVEPEAMKRLMEGVTDGLRRVVYLSVHGVERTDKLPFSMANVWGALDKQRAAEQEVLLKAKKALPSHAVVRVGKLVGGGAAAGGALELAPGDNLNGDASAALVADALGMALGRPEAVNASFSLAPSDAAALGASDWDDQFLKLVGPELLRRPLSALSAADGREWLREWAREFLRPGKKLTTPVEVADAADGVLLRFLSRATGYDDDDGDDDAAGGAWAAAAGSAAPKPDGALLLVAEAEPAPRIRVMRAEMESGMVVKEMSEQTVLARLEKDLAAVEKARLGKKR